MLEVQFKCDLTHKKDLFAETLNVFMHASEANVDGDDDDDIFNAADDDDNEGDKHSTSQPDGDNEDEEDDVDEPRRSSRTFSSNKPKRRSQSRLAGTRKQPAVSVFMTPLMLSADLAKFCGEDQLPRCTIVKKVWEYVKVSGPLHHVRTCTVPFRIPRG
jgi:chromatin remodeling complex protein RSC6